jgi:cell division protein FtsI (penicillin-binding protein 3)
MLLGVWVAGSAVLVARAVQLQVVTADIWQEAADDQHRTTGTLPAARGSILDRDGVSLAMSHETFRVGIAPQELLDADAAAERLSAALDLTPREARRMTRSDRRWVQVRGRFSAVTRRELAGIQGVYVTRELDRFYPHDQLARGVLGRVLDGEGMGGVEEQYEGLLTGVPGREVRARDSSGRPIPGQTWTVETPRSGGEVVLTLDLELQEIAEEALSTAVIETEAQGGTVLVTDPTTGEILAMASERDGSRNALAGINTPYEPGSTLKPFTVAAILDHGVASLGDSVDTEEGRWAINGRVLTDVHAEGMMTLGDALRVSSNVGVAKIAQGLTHAQQYEALRDFGFGMPTGVPLPGEAAGTLRRPGDWSGQSAASLAIGYEVAVTPIQMAMAYGALANGGWLMEPRLVKETRDRDGRVLERFPPRQVRKVLPGWLTREVNRVLVDVVEDGTGTAARLRTFRVAGKSGTSRVWGSEGGYIRGAYFSSFVGFFPAENPQLVVFVMLERPKGAYYGGATAAPVTRATLESILAARRPPLDRVALAQIAQASLPGEFTRTEDSDDVRFASVPLGGARRGTPSPVRMTPPAQGSVVPLPDLQGVPARDAVRRLHSMGLRVTWDGGGHVSRMLPEAGSLLSPGDTVHILVERGDDG